jgi:hypothetical protein
VWLESYHVVPGFATLRLGGFAFKSGLSISKDSRAASKRKAAKPQSRKVAKCLFHTQSPPC